MKLKLAKCEFGQSKIQFPYHIINHEGIRTLPEKTEEILKIKAPRNADEVHAFLEWRNSCQTTARASLTNTGET